jgi:hypothetical protein
MIGADVGEIGAESSALVGATVGCSTMPPPLAGEQVGSEGGMNDGLSLGSDIG